MPKLKKEYVVPSRPISSVEGIIYQQGQRIPAGTDVVLDDARLEELETAGVIEKRRSRSKDTGGEIE